MESAPPPVTDRINSVIDSCKLRCFSFPDTTGFRRLNTDLLTGICNGSVCPCTHTDEYYIRIDGNTVYLRYQTYQITSITNLPLQKTPPGTTFSIPLHGILTKYGLIYATLMSTLMSTSTVHQHHDHCEHSVAESTSHPLCH